MTKAIHHDESVRYSRRVILRTEKLYGTGYQSPGGATTTHKLARTLDLATRSDLHVLDIGCGTGGAAMHFAEKYAAKVTGVDIAQTPIEICKERAHEAKREGLTFVQGDACQTDLFPPDSFDLVWTRDSLLYAEDKPSCLSNTFNWLKAGGQLFITDFGQGDAKPSAEFQKYVTDSRFLLQDIDGYRHTIEEAGFTDIEPEDITPYFIELNKQELERLLQHREDFLADFDEAEFLYLTDRWKNKIRYAEDGNLAWLQFKARNPLP